MKNQYNFVPESDLDAFDGSLIGTIFLADSEASE